jgi:hypothetical protein
MRSVKARVAAAAAGRLCVELVVVFLGVYLAFWVENFRETQQEKERAQEIARVLDRDLADVMRVEQRLIDDARKGLQQWESEHQGGETPEPFYLRIAGSERPPTTNFQLIIQSRPVELFDAEFVFDLGFFYSELAGVGDRYVRYAEFTERQLLPNVVRGASVFYDSDGTALLPDYAAHMDRLGELAQFWENDVARARALRDRLTRFID